MSLINKKLGYIANKKKTEINDRGVEINTYDTPFSFRELYMPLTDEQLVLEGYGDDVKRVIVMYVDKKKWYGKIHTGDRAYLIDENTSEEGVKSLVTSDNVNCVKANYKVSVCAIQNLKIKVEFQLS